MYEIEVRGFAKVRARLDGFGALAFARMRRAMSAAVVTIEGEWKRTSPVGATGRYRQSIASEVRSAGSDIVGRVGSPVTYAAVQELGRRPGTAPPPGALDSWVRRVMGISDEDAPRVAFLIGRKLKRHGMPGRFYGRRAFERVRRRVIAFFSNAAADIVRVMNGN